MAGTPHGCSFQSIDGVWIAACACGQQWSDTEYANVEDLWIDHVDEHTGARPKAMGRGPVLS